MGVSTEENDNNLIFNNKQQSSEFVENTKGSESECYLPSEGVGESACSNSRSGK